MSLFGKLFGTKATTSIIDSLANAGDRLFTSDDERLKWQTLMQQIKAQPAAMRELTGIIAASSSSAFVAGGRSAIQYALAAVIGYHLFLRDLLVMLLDRPDMCDPLFTVEQLQSILNMFFGAL